ncbi:MAG: GAF domain-containing protein [Desulfobacteraceae bacterium]|jgi:signal transduction protein with GAF and PtsI domain|nr:MAG: GAF domain-containing protein [Desulfobacteraceae bacterium]
MKRQLLNYETLLKVTNAISHSRDPEEVVLMAVESITHALDVKGCTVFLINRDTDELEVAATYGLSDEYINKGPLSALKSITAALSEGPVAIYDVSDDPRMQYPEAAVKEGIASILVVPIIIRDRTIGALRVYTAEPWEFTLDDVNFVQAMAGIVGMAIDIAKYSKGLNKSIEILKTLRDPKTLKSRRRTPYEGVPKSFN